MLEDTLIHARALGAVARITLTFGSVNCAVGCVELPGDQAEQRDGDFVEEPYDDAAVSALPDAATEVQEDAETDPLLDVGPAAASDAGAQLDAEPTEPADCSALREAQDPDWTACCDAVDWDFGVPGCMAWGPPVPPSMPSTRLVPGTTPQVIR